MTILSNIVLLNSIHALEHYECLPLLIDLARFPILDVGRVRNFADLDAALVETSCPVVRHFLLRHELLLVFDVVVDLDVLGSLDVEGVRTVEVVNFLSVFLVHHRGLEAQSLLRTVFLYAEGAHELIGERILVEVESNGFFQTIELSPIERDLVVDQLDQGVVVPEAPRKLILTKVLRYEHFPSTFDLGDEDVLRKLDAPYQGFQEESTIHQV